MTKAMARLELLMAKEKHIVVISGSELGTGNLVDVEIWFGATQIASALGARSVEKGLEQALEQIGE